MAHNQRFASDVFYVNGRAIPAAYFQQVDTAQAAAFNADTGGDWSPSSPVVIGGAGVSIAGPWVLVNGQRIVTPSGSGVRVVFADNDAPLIHPTNFPLASRTIVTPCSAAARRVGRTAPAVRSNSLDLHAAGLAGLHPGSRWLVPLAVHDGAVFGSVTLNFTTVPHTSLPTSLPQMRVTAVDVFGNITPLGGASGTPGWVSYPKPGNVLAYSGLNLQLLYPLRGTVIVNRSAFVYYADVIDESGGAGALGGNAFQDLTCTFSSLPLLGVE